MFIIINQGLFIIYFINVLNDDDRDIYYYDKERSIQTNSLRPEMLHVPSSKKEGGMSSAKPKIMKK